MAGDYIIIQKSNHGPVKKMSVYCVAELLTTGEMQRLVNKKKIRKGNYLYWVEKHEVDEVDPYGDLKPEDEYVSIDEMTDEEITEGVEIFNTLEEDEKNT